MRVVGAIARKDVRETFSTRAVWWPALVIPGALVVGLPAACGYLIGSAPVSGGETLPPELMRELLGQLPANLARSLRGMPDQAAGAVLLGGHFAAPLFLLAPLELVAAVGAAAFVGERERRSLEALLYTPASDAELFTGKLLAALGPALALAWSSFALYVPALTYACWPVLPSFWFPTPIWPTWILWLLPAMLAMVALGTVVISTRARSQLAAQQLGALVGVAASAVFLGQFAGLAQASSVVLLLAGGALWLLNGLLLLLALRVFKRDRLILRL
jgi:ABC-type Na+ efflux pump permease subunit